MKGVKEVKTSRASRRWSPGSLDPGNWLLPIACVAGLCLAGCDEAKSPSQPSAPAAGTFSITGRVFANDLGPAAGVAGARVDIINGPNQGRQTDADAAGMFRFDQLSGGFVTLRALAPDYLGTLESLTLTATAVVNLGLATATLTTTGEVVNVETAASMGSVEITGAVSPTFSDAAGHFKVAAYSASEAPLSIIFTGPGNVRRVTGLRVPGDFTTVSLIPTSFNLAAFEELCRGANGLRRLVTAPRLIVQLADLQFTTPSALTAVALDSAMSDADAQAMVDDMVFSLQTLTGDNLREFSSVTLDRAPAASVVNLLTSGAVTVSRFAGLRSGNNIVGYGRYQQLPSGEVTGGLAMLDGSYDRDPGVRRRVRIHELGHAIGYGHVATGFSVMNATNGSEFPTPLDRAVTRVAFRRPPGNRPPDTDPIGTTAAAPGGVAFWSAPIR